MKQFNVLPIFLLFFLLACLNSCSVVKGIFDAGMGVGIFLTILVVVLVIVFITRSGGAKN